MDHHLIHGRDVSSFDLPSTHRLPTVSAAEALEDLDGNPTRFLPFGFDDLDKLLSPSFSTALDKSTVGGVQKGQVTELWGPPGVGKTSLGIQLSSVALSKGQGVVWVDGHFALCGERLAAALAARVKTSDGEFPDPLRGFVHFTCPTLPHFIALLCRPTESVIPKQTSLVIVDSFSALLNQSFPRVLDAKRDVKVGKGTSLLSGRHQVLQYVVGALQKLAATRDIAIVVLSQCATKMLSGGGATLTPAINASAWEKGISTRLVLFRDWGVQEETSVGLHFLGAQKLDGKAYIGSGGDVIAFRIEPTGLVAAECDTNLPSITLALAPSQKRKLMDTGFEIADSEDEDYGWQIEDEEDVPPPPSQWQGSEDLLLNQQQESDENEDHPQDTNDDEDTRQYTNLEILDRAAKS